ncbi:hypothetical protein ACW7BJ_27460 [Azospirillum argentinense]
MSHTTSLGPHIRDPRLRALFAPDEASPTSRPSHPPSHSGIEPTLFAEIMSAIAPVLERASREILQ